MLMFLFLTLASCSSSKPNPPQKKTETILVGDSINDYDAANYNDVTFYAYNNYKLKEKTKNYINSFNEIQKF